ncbi:MAG: HAD family hydrolase [Burkholderiaceae bacterium]
MPNSKTAAGQPPSKRTDRGLALFDLDHTLIPIDSDVMWAEHLVKLGVVDSAWHSKRNDYFYEQYKQGTLDIDEFLTFQLAPLGAHNRSTLENWRAEFLQTQVMPNLLSAAKDLVAKHQAAGDLVAIVTATNEFITRPIADAFGVDHLIATLVETKADGEFTGRHAGLPSFREGKIVRVAQWLAEQEDCLLQDFATSTFYSDSLNDLPLLAQVTHPVATNPDPTLLAHAQAQGWPVIRLW